MRLLIDANILLDVLQKREPYYKDSSAVWKLCETEQAKGYVSVLTFANLVYVMRRELTPSKIEEILEMLTLIFEFTKAGTGDLLHDGMILRMHCRVRQQNGYARIISSPEIYVILIRAK